MNQKLWMAFAGVAATVAMVACGDDDGNGDGSGLRVIATNSIVADWVEQVGGDIAEQRDECDLGFFVIVEQYHA